VTSFGNSTAMYKALKTLHPGGIRTQDLLFCRRTPGRQGTAGRGLKAYLHGQWFSVLDSTAASKDRNNPPFCAVSDAAVASDTENHGSCKQTFTVPSRRWDILSSSSETWVMTSENGVVPKSRLNKLEGFLFLLITSLLEPGLPDGLFSNKKSKFG
jgi:hypothetical protein